MSGRRAAAHCDVAATSPGAGNDARAVVRLMTSAETHPTSRHKLRRSGARMRACPPERAAHARPTSARPVYIPACAVRERIGWDYGRRQPTTDERDGYPAAHMWPIFCVAIGWTTTTAPTAIAIHDLAAASACAARDTSTCPRRGPMTIDIFDNPAACEYFPRLVQAPADRLKRCGRAA